MAVHPEIEWVYATANGPEKQIADIENMMTKGIDGLVVLATESAPLTPTAKKGHEAGVFIVNVLQHPIACGAITRWTILKHLVTNVICQVGAFVNITNHYGVKACHLFRLKMGLTGPFWLTLVHFEDASLLSLKMGFTRQVKCNTMCVIRVMETRVKQVHFDQSV
jgi:hypothetical protein